MIYLVWEFGTDALPLIVPISSEVLISSSLQNISGGPLICRMQPAELNFVAALLFC